MNQTFSLKEVFFIISITLLGIVIAVSFQLLLLIGFLPGFFVLVGICLKKGYKLQEVINDSFKGFMKTRNVMIILLLVGLLLPAWEYAGTIHAMVQYALSIIHPGYFYISAFFCTLIISMILGTSVGNRVSCNGNCLISH